MNRLNELQYILIGLRSRIGVVAEQGISDGTSERDSVLYTLSKSYIEAADERATHITIRDLGE